MLRLVLIPLLVTGTHLKVDQRAMLLPKTGSRIEYAGAFILSLIVGSDTVLNDVKQVDLDSFV